MLDRAVGSKAGWTRVAFGDVVRLSKERAKNPDAEGYERLVGLEHIDPGDLRIRRWANIADGTTFTSVFRPGQVLFGKRRAYQRKVAVASFEGVCSGDIYVLEPANHRLMAELLPFLCQTDAFFEHAVGTSAGSLSPRTNWSSLASFQILLPPTPHQTRLVSLLTATEQVKNAYVSVQANLHILLEAFGRSILETHSSEMQKVGQLAKFTSGKQISVSGLPQFPTSISSIPVYGGNGMSGYTEKPLEECLSPTVVVGRVGQYCGTALLTSGPSWITDNALYPKTIDPKLDMTFLYICLRARQLNKGKIGEYLPLITQSVVHEAEIPFFAQDLQLEFVARYRLIERQYEAATQRLKQIHDLHRAASNEIF